MNVNGLDVEGSMFRDMDGKAKPGIRSGVKSGHIRVTEEKIAVLPDYLRFEKGIYIAFIKSGNDICSYGMASHSYGCRLHTRR